MFLIFRRIYPRFSSIEEAVLTQLRGACIFLIFFSEETRNIFSLAYFQVTRSYLGKLFAILWVLLGITLFSMLTATVTTEIIDANSPASTDMEGRQVGCVLNFEVEDKALAFYWPWPSIDLGLLLTLAFY